MNLMNLKTIIKRLFGVYNYDRMVEKKVKQCLSLYSKGGVLNKLLSYRLYIKIRHNYNVCIYPTVKVGKNFYLAHGHDVTIGRTAIIGDNCRVYPYFYVMAAIKNDKELKGKRRHALIGNDCMCGAKSTIIGPVTIGDNVTIGAGAMITKDVPSHSVVKGVNQIRPKRYEEIPDKYKEEWLKLNPEYVKD